MTAAGRARHNTVSSSCYPVWQAERAAVGGQPLVHRCPEVHVTCKTGVSCLSYALVRQTLVNNRPAGCQSPLSAHRLLGAENLPVGIWVDIIDRAVLGNYHDREALHTGTLRQLIQVLGGLVSVSCLADSKPTMSSWLRIGPKD